MFFEQRRREDLLVSYATLESHRLTGKRLREPEAPRALVVGARVAVTAKCACGVSIASSSRAVVAASNEACRCRSSHVDRSCAGSVSRRPSSDSSHDSCTAPIASVST